MTARFGATGASSAAVAVGVDVRADLVDPGQEDQGRVAEHAPEPSLDLPGRRVVGHLAQEPCRRSVEPRTQKAGKEEQRDCPEADERDDPENVLERPREGAEREQGGDEADGDPTGQVDRPEDPALRPGRLAPAAHQQSHHRDEDGRADDR